MKIVLPEHVAKIICCLQQHGYEAYAVGGCVRDSILGRVPDDWDITTSAKPEEVKALFARTIDTGIQHGTVTVMQGKEGFEVTTYRIDGTYEDARHPREVLFTPCLTEDLKRRDFTINAMAYNDKDGLVDRFDGLKDLRERRIRCVGDACARFGEDALRMMRAVRFAAQLGFSVDTDTRTAIRKLAPSLKKISAERIRTELEKLLLSPHPEALELLYELGVTDVVLPEFSVMMQTPQNNPHHRYSVGQHTIEALKLVPPERILRLTMLFHDVAKPVCRMTDEHGIDHFRGHPQAGVSLTRSIMRRLKFDNAAIQRVTALVAIHDNYPSLKPERFRRALVRDGLEQYPDWFSVRRADVGAQSAFRREEKLAFVAQCESLYREIMNRGDCLCISDLAVSGTDLIQAGMKPGKELGSALKELLLDVLDHPEWNEKEILLTRCRQREYF